MRSPVDAARVHELVRHLGRRCTSAALVSIRSGLVRYPGVDEESFVERVMVFLEAWHAD